MISVLLHLGYGFVRASLTLPFRVGRGRDRFLRDFAPEGLLPATQTQRELSADFEKCIGCGFCDLALDDSGGALSDISLSLWRAPETWPALGSALAELEKRDLAAAEALCPTEVPLSKLVAELGGVLRNWEEWKSTLGTLKDGLLHT